MITFKIIPDLDIKFVSKEFYAMCPFDGKPDVYELSIQYKSNELGVESKSLSDWLLTFRDKSIACEALIEEIAYGLNELLSPKEIKIVLKQSIRDRLKLKVKKEIK